MDKRIELLEERTVIFLEKTKKQREIFPVRCLRQTPAWQIYFPGPTGTDPADRSESDPLSP